jgi:hypothetical protein
MRNFLTAMAANYVAGTALSGRASSKRGCL